MKSLHLLKTLVDLFLFLSVLGALTLLVAAPIKIFYPTIDIPIKMDGVGELGSDWLSILVIILGGVSTFFFIYAVFILRKVLISFGKNQIFTDTIVGYFGTIGKCVIAAAVLRTVPLFLYQMFSTNHLKIELAGGFDSLLLAICLGLLFIVIAEIFRKAKNIKEENELTV